MISPYAVINGVDRPTDVSTWTKDKLVDYNWNSKGSHVIFIFVSSEQFKCMSMCETCKEAWDILETIHKKIMILKNSKLQMLTSRFDEIRM